MSQNPDQEKPGMSEVPEEDLFLRRWSPRAFAETSVEIATLKAIFSVGQWAALSYNEHPWRFVVDRLGDPAWLRVFVESLTAADQSWTKSAPVLFAWFSKKTFCQNGAANRVSQHDVGVASAQISLGATTHGLYNHGMAVFEPE
jgi:hypothetical protein